MSLQMLSHKVNSMSLTLLLFACWKGGEEKGLGRRRYRFLLDLESCCMFVHARGGGRLGGGVRGGKGNFGGSYFILPPLPPLPSLLVQLLLLLLLLPTATSTQRQI